MTMGNLVYNLSKLLGYREIKPAWEVVSTQKNYIKIEPSEAHTILDEEEHITLAGQIYNSDSHYSLVDIPKLEYFIARNNLSTYKYINEDRDCDDFSYMLQGDVTKWDPKLAFGIVWGVVPEGYGHAWNWCIGTDKKVWFIEPQQNRIFRPKENYKLSLLIM